MFKNKQETIYFRVGGGGGGGGTTETMVLKTTKLSRYRYSSVQ